jgi:hypothetical protein
MSTRWNSAVWAVGAALVAVAAAAGCGRIVPAPSVAPPGVIARVDDRFLTIDDLRMIDPAGTLSADEVRNVVENWIERELLMKIARDRGILADTAVRWEMEAARSEVAIRGLGRAIRAEAADETTARVMIERDLATTRKASRVEAFPWKVK